MKIEAPGGETADLHRRVWVGVGGNIGAVVPADLAASLGVESDLDIATPWTLRLLQVEGRQPGPTSTAGLSPQELIIPVVVMTPTAQAMAGRRPASSGR